MRKAQLEEKIQELQEESKFLHNIITKLLHDYIEIKPIPKGDIAERIVVFTEPVRGNNVTAQTLIFLKDLKFTGNLELSGTTNL